MVLFSENILEHEPFSMMMIDFIFAFRVKRNTVEAAQISPPIEQP